jgi:hypothetical protein
MKMKNPVKPKPFHQQAHQMDMEKLFDYLKEQNFGSIEEINDFLNKNVTGRRISDAIPKKRGKKQIKRKLPI